MAWLLAACFVCSSPVCCVYVGKEGHTRLVSQMARKGCGGWEAEYQGGFCSVGSLKPSNASVDTKLKYTATKLGV